MVGPERSEVVLKVKVTEDVVKFVVRNYKAASFGVNEIRFSIEKDRQHFEGNYGKNS